MRVDVSVIPRPPNENCSRKLISIGGESQGVDKGSPFRGTWREGETEAYRLYIVSYQLSSMIHKLQSQGRPTQR